MNKETKFYGKCKSYYEYDVVVDNKVVLSRETNKDFAVAVLNCYLEQKKHDNIYLNTIKKVRYTMMDKEDFYKYKVVMNDFIFYANDIAYIKRTLTMQVKKQQAQNNRASVYIVGSRIDACFTLVRKDDGRWYSED